MARRIGAKIRRRRNKRGLTQAQVAERAQCGETYFGRIERGDCMPSMEMLFEIAGALRTTPSDLLFDCRPGPDREQIKQDINRLLVQMNDLLDRL